MPALTYRTLISPPVPVADDRLVPNGDKRMFSPLTTTLIAGDHDAILVDPPLTSDQAAVVGDWIDDSGRVLRAIYVTHGHGDHWFGSGPLIDRFPGTVVYASEGTIALMRAQVWPKRLAEWDALFPGQVPQVEVLAVTPTGGQVELEGHDLHVVELGHTDTDSTTVLHVPGIALVVAGDAVYNHVHPCLGEAQGDGIKHWLDALDAIEALGPAAVVSGHQDETRTDDPATIGETRQYLLDARDQLDQQTDAGGFFDAMMKLYPDRVNPGALWSSAVALFGEGGAP
jgi:glyoxylase-like metal-dependent hydrolase (beta-lactamase superfamily II)